MTRHLCLGIASFLLQQAKSKQNKTKKRSVSELSFFLRKRFNTTVSFLLFTAGSLFHHKMYLIKDVVN